MSIFNYKKEAKLYIVYGGNQYLIDISEISFSQTFTENSYKVKTLHEPHKMFEGSVINKANPANFEFVIPALQEDDLSIVVDLLLDYNSNTSLNTFDLYVETQKDIFFIETCVMTEGTFNIERLKALGISITGEGTKLTKAGNYGVFTIPGTPITRSSTRSYNIVRVLDITLDSTLLDNVYSASVQLQNNIEWVPYTNIHASLDTTDTASSMYPSEFTLEDRIFAGSFSQYVQDDDLQNWSTNADLRIQALDGTYGFDFNMNSVSYTNRLSVDSVFTKKHDWRLIESPTQLSNLVTYITT